MMNSARAQFHPEIERWFSERHGGPTDVQARSWPRIAAGENLLITAPTGSGKTLTAFLWAINRFVTGELGTGATRVLYISPLKALNNDIQRNLLSPLAELAARFTAAGLDFPAIAVETRSGDTDPGDRRRMLRHPPEILITTPESLNLLLSSRGGRGLLRNIGTVILDEIHGVVGGKRGAYLMSAVERLVPMSGEFQRIALSATVRPLSVVAEFVAGYRLTGDAGYERRPIATVDSVAQKHYDITVRYPEEAAGSSQDELWDALARDFVARIDRNRSTLLFVNSRALCEKITARINAAAGKTLAYAHHGSLSRELRFEVEQKLKNGELAAIVATSSLEMGIDIGSLDEVILVQSPDSISSAIQRIGRAGHGVGEVSRGTVYPTHPVDFIEAAVLSRAVLEKDIEPVHPVDCPLDVLAQVIISMTGIDTWHLDDLFMELRRSAPFHNLSQSQFELVVNMLAGRYAANHIRELRPRVNVDRLDHTIKARPGALMSLYLSGGVIPDRGYFQLRHEDNNARIGELDEEFVWEADIGNVFSFGTQQWQVRKITHNDVIVAPAARNSAGPPFWKAESLSRDFHYAGRVGEFLEYADGRVDDDDFVDELATDYHLEVPLATELRDFLRRQRRHCNASLPHRHHLLAETVRTAPGWAGGNQLVLHTGWGARVNRPFAMALEAGWLETWGDQPDIYVGNESLVVQLPPETGIDEIIELAPARQLEQRLRQRLEGSGFFGARFRENAGRALLLSRGRFNERKPLWMSRLQSRKLFDAVLKYEDFPILLETWRACLHDEFDMENLRLLLEELERGEIRITEVASETPSPFAQSLAWGQINTYMYMDDEPRATRTSQLRTSLLEEVVFNPGIRPPVPLDIKRDFEARRQRLLDGYRPEGEDEIVEWVKERTAIPLPEWIWGAPGGKLEVIDMGDARLVVATEDRDALLLALRGDGDEEETATRIANWLQYYGPVSTAEITARLGVPERLLLPVLRRLEEDRALIRGVLVKGDDRSLWCDADNYEVLLRFMRQRSKTAFDPLPAGELPLFVHTWQTRWGGTDPVERLFETIERLRCLPQPAGFWETELLPARLPDYDPQWLDLLLQQNDLMWTGTGEGQIAFTFREDLDLMDASCPEEAARTTAREWLPDTAGRYDFSALLERSGQPAAVLARTLWDAVWAGTVSNDSMGALRKGIENGFEVPAVADHEGGRRRNARRGFNAWRQAVPFAGNWFRIAWPLPAADLMQAEELNKDRVRVLMDRYGILFRELLQRELPAFRWQPLFRSIRLMELSGELLSGYFFRDIPGPQFISPEAFRLLQRQLPEDAVYWINAADPASLCGLGIDGTRADLPRRISGNHLVYHGARLVLVSERNGKSLHIKVPADDDALPRYLDVLRHMLYRRFQPARSIAIEQINDVPANGSEYLDALATAFDVERDYKAVRIRREF